MSRMYDIRVEISGFEAKAVQKIKDAANELWDFEWGFGTISSSPVLCGQGQCNLGGGKTDYTFSKELTREIFKANGKPCKILINTTDLDDLPTDSYEFDENSKLD
jgi:hypothetical protein